MVCEVKKTAGKPTQVCLRTSSGRVLLQSTETCSVKVGQLESSISSNPGVVLQVVNVLPAPTPSSN